MGEVRYTPYGETRYEWGITPTDRRYTGQRWDSGLALYDYRARYYHPVLGRFISADPVVPEPGNPQALNRYAYVLNNPIRYTDPSGHCVAGIDTAVCVAAGLALLKAIDYGWTAWDSYQSLKVINDPNASEADKAAASANLALTAAFEAAEPDDLLPVALPLDDLARLGILKLGKEAGQEAAERVRKEVAEEAPIVIGENMERVRKYADMIGGKTINDFIPTERWSMEANETWIGQMRAEGREIIDIGPDFQRRLDRVTSGIRPDAPAYNLERQVLQGYERYRKVFQRSGKYWGGVPGFD